MDDESVIEHLVREALEFSCPISFAKDLWLDQFLLESESASSFCLHDLGIALITIRLFPNDVLNRLARFAEIALCLPLERHQRFPLSVV